MLFKLSALLVALHGYVLLCAQSLIPKEVKVTAQLIHADSTTPRAMVFNFLNPFIRGRKSAAFDEQNRLAAFQEMVFTQNMTIQYNSTFINLLVAPGDSVHLVIDGSRLKEKDFRWLSIRGDNALASQQLNQWHYYYNTHFTQLLAPAGSLPAMTDSIRSAYRQSLLMLDDYARTHSLMPAVKSWAENDIKYTVSYLAADYLATEDSATGRLSLNDQLYRDALFDQYNPAGFQSMMFPYHLGNYYQTVLKSDSTIGVLRQNMRYKEAAEKALYLLGREPKSISRDYMLFSFTSGLLPRSPRLLDSLPALSSMFADGLAYSYIVKAGLAIDNPRPNETPIAGMLQLSQKGINKMPAVEILRYFSKKYAGKVIYIDVYATWCTPCLQEAEKMPLIKAGVDTAKIVFLNICLQSDQKAWQTLVKRRDYTDENYFLSDDATKLFMGMYGIEGFPSYILINKQGEIQSMKAPRPSDGELLIRTLNKLTD
jgi:thiol-disulfide isomerase/thioredoxin